MPRKKARLCVLDSKTCLCIPCMGERFLYYHMSVFDLDSCGGLDADIGIGGIIALSFSIHIEISFSKDGKRDFLNNDGRFQGVVRTVTKKVLLFFLTL